MPLSPPVLFSRRRFVAASAAGAGLALLGGCAVPVPDSEPDPLVRLAEAASRDARELAAADASHGPSAAGLRQIAEVRRIHAERMADEVRREARGDLAPEGSDLIESTRPPGQLSTATPDTVVCPPVDEVRARLSADARAAGEFAVTAEGYRAELTAAVSAACTTALEVVLS